MSERVVSAQSLNRFLNPGVSFKPAAYWFWHSIPEESVMRQQLSDFHAQGYGTILIQTRLAFPRELYLCSNFLAAYRTAVAIMGELGLVAGLYDDYNWISGHAGGRTVEGNEHLREQHLFWAFSETSGGTIDGIDAPFIRSMGRDIQTWLYEDGEVCFGDWQLISALLVPSQNSAQENIIDVTADVALFGRSNACEFLYESLIPEGFRLVVFVAGRCLTSRLINYLMPEAGARFVEVGLQPYADALDGLMPTPLSFLFFDQPAAGFYLWRQIEGDLGNSLMFTPWLQTEIEAIAKRSFGEVLLALLTDTGAEKATLRCSFFRVYTRLIHDGFFEPVRAFCRANRLRLTGHEILPHVGSWELNGGFTSIDPRVAPAVDFFGLDALRDETAADANNFDAQLAPKLADSVARAHGRSRSIVEIYATATRTERRGAGQWELSPTELRAQSIRLHMLGARQIVMHGLYQTDGFEDDERLFVNPRFDFAPGLNFEPWWPYHRLIATETARLSAFIEDLKPDTPVALFYSLATAWIEGPKHAHAKDFGAWCEALEAIGCNYMIIDETALEQAIVQPGSLEASGLSFAALAMPSTTRLSALAKSKIAAFRAAGGHIWVSGTEDLDIPQTEVIRSDELNEETVTDLLNKLPPTGLPVRAEKGIRQLSGLDGDGYHRLVLFNETSRSRSAHIQSNFEIEVWDCTTGASHPQGIVGDLTLDLAEQDLICLRMKEIEVNGSALRFPPSKPSPTSIEALSEGWMFRPDNSPLPKPISVATGWQDQGYADFSGTGVYIRDIDLTESGRLELDLPGASVAASVFLDDRLIGELYRPPFQMALGSVAAGRHKLEIRVRNTAANRYYAGTSYAGEPWPDKSGLTAPPSLLIFADTNAEAS